MRSDVYLKGLLRTLGDDPNNEVKSLTCSPDMIFPVLTRNIQTINSKFDALLAILSQPNDNNFKIYAICL